MQRTTVNVSPSPVLHKELLFMEWSCEANGIYTLLENYNLAGP